MREKDLKKIILTIALIGIFTITLATSIFLYLDYQSSLNEESSSNNDDNDDDDDDDDDNDESGGGWGCHFLPQSMLKVLQQYSINIE